MSNHEEYILSHPATTDSEEFAHNIAYGLIESKTAACCSILQPVESYYFGYGKICREKEYLIIIKT